MLILEPAENPPLIFIQIISSSESGSHSKPEELSHIRLFSMEPGQENIAISNLARSALKIEKTGNHFRFLYTTSPMESFAYKEVLSCELSVQPRYVSIFAIQGWADNKCIPAYFDYFTLDAIPCGQSDK